jgi:PKD domain-containing protein
MAHSARFHRTTAIAGVVAVLLGVGTAPALASHPSADSRGHLAQTTLQGFKKSATSVVVPAVVVDQVTVRPRAHREIKIQAQKPGSKKFVTVGHTFSDKHGDALVTFAPTKAGSWHFRLLLPATRQATQLVSASRLVKTSVDTLPPGPVADINIAQGVGSELNLTWTNPTDADFAGVMIRRLQGATPPATPSQGTLVTTTDKFATSFSDQGLKGGTTYSYALFAVDGVNNKSVGVTRTAVSGAATTAVLTINGSSGPNANDTVNVSQAYDVSTGTHAGRTLAMVSGTLDYGDGTTPEEFVGDPSTWAPAGHQYATTGTFTASLTVVDSASASVTTTVHVHVVESPTATVTVDPQSVLEKNKPVTFHSSGITPTGTTFTDFDYFSGAGDNFVQGTGGPPASFQITFAVPGTYTVTVEGFNDAGGVATAQVQVVIIDAPPTP